MKDSGKAEIKALLNSIEEGTPILIKFDDGEWHGVFEGFDAGGSVMMRDLAAVHEAEVISLPELTRILVDRIQYVSNQLNDGISDEEA